MTSVCYVFNEKPPTVCALADCIARLDWEYPTAPDRGGSPADTQSFVMLVSDMRQDFDAINPGWEITRTLPSSYWYMQNFDL